MEEVWVSRRLSIQALENSLSRDNRASLHCVYTYTCTEHTLYMCKYTLHVQCTVYTHMYMYIECTCAYIHMYMKNTVMVGPDKPVIPGQRLFRASQLSSAGNMHNLSGTPPSFIYTWWTIILVVLWHQNYTCTCTCTCICVSIYNVHVHVHVLHVYMYVCIRCTWSPSPPIDLSARHETGDLKIRLFRSRVLIRCVYSIRTPH